jgi:hypothetical protein
VYSEELEEIARNIVEAKRRSDDLKWRIATVECQGHDASAQRELLLRFECTLLQLTTYRSVLLCKISPLI